MLVGFIGAPCSGKTTTAARLFADLKDNGFVAEYIAERARAHIARKRFKGYGGYGLDNDDQVEIAFDQFEHECWLNGDNVIVVTDSCVLNSLLYMGPMYRDEMIERNGLIADAIEQYDLLFICPPVPHPDAPDVNRVHSDIEALAINELIDTVLMPLLKDKKIVALSGDSKTRAATAYLAVIESLRLC